MNLAIDLAAAMLGDRIDDRFRHQRAGGTGLHALSACNAGGQSHRIVEVEYRLGIYIAEAHPDHVIDLDLAAGAHAQPTIDAGVEIDRHGGMRQIGFQNVDEPETASRRFSGPRPNARIATRGRVNPLAAADRRAIAPLPSGALLRRDRSRSSPPCLAWACVCKRQRERARPRPRPCRRGNCRRRGSQVLATSRDAGCRCLRAGRPARSFRPAGRRPHFHQA